MYPIQHLMNSSLTWSITSVTITCLCIICYSVADIPAALWFHSLEKNWLYEIFGKITLFGDSLSYLVGGLLLFILFRNKNLYRAYSGLYLFITVAVSGLTADLVKFITGRARPTLYFSEYLFGFGFFHTEHSWTSFPSGHSATALSVATLFALLYPRWRRVSYFAGSLVAFSRIFLAQHYISDVIAGSFLGIVSSFFFYKYYFKLKRDAFDPNKN